MKDSGYFFSDSPVSEEKRASGIGACLLWKRGCGFLLVCWETFWCSAAAQALRGHFLVFLEQNVL